MYVYDYGPPGHHGHSHSSSIMLPEDSPLQLQWYPMVQLSDSAQNSHAEFMVGGGSFWNGPSDHTDPGEDQENDCAPQAAKVRMIIVAASRCSRIWY